MGDSVEDLLAQIKAQYSDANQANASPQSHAEESPQSSPSQPSSSQSSFSHSPTSPQPSGLSPHSIDDLLAEVEGKPSIPQQSGTRPSDRSPLPAIPPDRQQSVFPAQPPANQESPRITSQSKAATDRLLHELKTQYDEHDRAEELKQQAQHRIEEQKRQAELQQEQLRQAELKRQRQIVIARQAEEWLKRLDPHSGEAAWFDEFAAKYESRLEAAIDYLGLEE